MSDKTTKAVALNEDFTQVCVWQGTVVGEESKDEFISWLKDEFEVQGQYLEEILTKPSVCPEHGIIPNTGGRNDVFFAIKDGDQTKGSFISKRLQYGIRWVEDVLSATNGGINKLGQPTLYPEHVKEYISWDAN